MLYPDEREIPLDGNVKHQVKHMMGERSPYHIYYYFTPYITDDNKKSFTGMRVLQNELHAIGECTSFSYVYDAGYFVDHDEQSLGKFYTAEEFNKKHFK